MKIQWSRLELSRAPVIKIKLNVTFSGPGRKKLFQKLSVHLQPMCSPVFTISFRPIVNCDPAVSPIAPQHGGFNTRSSRGRPGGAPPNCLTPGGASPQDFKHLEEPRKTWGSIIRVPKHVEKVRGNIKRPGVVAKHVEERHQRTKSPGGVAGER